MDEPKAALGVDRTLGMIIAGPAHSCPEPSN